MPRNTLDKGDPYHCQCQKTGRLLREALGMEKDRLMVCFQSRFGQAEWLQPYFDKTLEGLPAKGVRRLAVVMPGFSADCLETLEEIAIRGRETFLEAGGESYATIPCLNDSPDGMEMLESLARRELAGWL
jgi:ferrochelatase